jgi:hypothetical protein
MIDPEHDLPIKQQTEALKIVRSTVYYEPRPVSETDLWPMRRIDELSLSYPFAGSRMRPEFPSGIISGMQPTIQSWFSQRVGERRVAHGDGDRLQRSGGSQS